MMGSQTAVSVNNPPHPTQSILPGKNIVRSINLLIPHVETQDFASLLLLVIIIDNITQSFTEKTQRTAEFWG